ncbi:MAG: TetR/AcrR family transcriptional regulator [Myxococcota bacterium]|nr:TetR/AcrR family transcriptional regulator [Myxococcota bacterium]
MTNSRPAPSAKRGGDPPIGPARREFQQERARATYEALLKAAQELFLQNGFRATQVPEIAKRAGVSVGAFYRYFDDKRAVLIEIIHGTLESNRLAQARALRVWRRRITSGEADPRAFLEVAVEFTAQHLTVHADLLRTFVALSYEDEEVAALRRAYDESERREFARFIAAVTPRERIPSPLAAARVVDIAIEEIARWGSLEGGRAAKEARAALVEMLDRYLFA